MELLACGLTVLLCIFIYKLLDRILRQPRLGTYADRYIFITGCDSGIGCSLAIRLHALGCYVFAGCFTEQGKTMLNNICSERMHTVSLDVTNRDSIIGAFELISAKLQSAGKGLWGIVNNAGILKSIGPVDWLTADDYRRHCDVNLFGLIDVTMTFLPLVKKTRGRIVNISSNLGLMPSPVFTSYSVSKFGVEAFSDALRFTLKPLGCKVVLVEPSVFKTPISSMENFQASCDRAWNQCPPATQEEYTTEYMYRFKRYLRRYENVPSDLSPVIVACELALLARYPRPRYRVGFSAVLMSIVALLPEFVGDWILAKTIQLPNRAIP